MVPPNTDACNIRGPYSIIDESSNLQFVGQCICYLGSEAKNALYKLDLLPKEEFPKTVSSCILQHVLLIKSNLPKLIPLAAA